MRVALGFSLLLLAGCASDRLALVPSPRVDLSGRWKLNEADSDDPQRVALSQNAGPAGGAPGATGGQGGQGGRGGRGGGRGGGNAGGYGGGPAGPAMPGVNALSDGLRWPGKELEIKQDGGIVTIASLGIRQVYRPAADKSPPPPKPKADDSAGRGRDPRSLGGGPPPACGWDASTLVVQAENPDDDNPPFEERYSLSEDGSRLIEVVAFKGGRSRGFTVSRVWDRVAPDLPGANSAGKPPQ